MVFFTRQNLFAKRLISHASRMRQRYLHLGLVVEHFRLGFSFNADQRHLKDRWREMKGNYISLLMKIQDVWTKLLHSYFWDIFGKMDHHFLSKSVNPSFSQVPHMVQKSGMQLPHIGRKLQFRNTCWLPAKPVLLGIALFGAGISEGKKTSMRRVNKKTWNW